MNNLRIPLLLVLAVLASQLSTAQQVRLFGVVSDTEGKPIPFATVYIDATSYGTSTDDAGAFELKIPARNEKIELITSLVGFQTVKTTVSLIEKKEVGVNIKLTGVVFEEAIVQGKMDRFWKKKWRIFRNGLLGDVSPTRNYEFTNRENIVLEYDEEDKYVLAKSNEPFTIVNETLGYNIKVELQYFKSDGIFTQFSAYKYFEENLSDDEKIREQQIENRKKTYFSTIRHFLVSLKNGKLDENKYEVYKINKMNQVFLGRTTLMEEINSGRLVPVNSSDIYAYDEGKNAHFLHSDQSLLIFNKNFASYQGNPFSDYYYEFSRIDLPNFLLQFNPNGYILKPNGLMLSYHWSKEGLGLQLPENYIPNGYDDEVQQHRESLKTIDLAPILAKQVAIDSVIIENPAILAQTLTFNRYEEEDDEPDYFYEPDVRYKLVEQDGNQPIWQILKRIAGLRVVMNNNTGEYDIYLQGSNMSLIASPGEDKTPNLVINNRVYRTRQEVMDQLLAIDTRQVKEVGLIKYGGGAIFGATGGHGTIVILMDNFKDVH